MLNQSRRQVQRDFPATGTSRAGVVGDAPHERDEEGDYSCASKARIASASIAAAKIARMATSAAVPR